MKRRAFITLLGGAAAWSIAPRAQEPMPVIGFLSGRSPYESATVVGAFGQGLGETGYFESKNVIIEYRWAEGRYDRLPALAGELVSRHVATIAAVGSPNSGQAAKAATATIPIVFVSGADPVQEGLVASLNRPGGNVTGVAPLLPAMEGKRFGLLREIIPNAPLIGALLNPTFTNFNTQVNDIQETARAVSQQLVLLRASSEEEIESAFATAAKQQARGLLVAADPFLLSRRERIVGLAARYAIPAIYEVREYARAGGLMSYGISLTNAYREAGVYVGRILKGEKPANLPVLQPDKFDFVINLKTARTLALTIPPGLLSIADEVIE